MISSELPTAFADGAVLLGTSSSANSANSLAEVLKSRLSIYFARVRSDKAETLNDNVRDLELLTGRETLRVVERIHNIIDKPDPEKQQSKEMVTSDIPLIGTRDLAEIRTLLSLTFKWAVQPLLLRVSELWSGSMHGDKIVYLPADANDSQLLSRLIISLFSLIFPEGVQGRISQTLIASTLLSFHAKDILLPSISLGWLPQSQSSELMAPLHEARPLVTRFLRLLNPAQAIVALSNAMTTPLSPSHTRKACTQFLTKQLLRPNGVKGLFEAALSSDDSVIDNTKLEQVAKTLNSVPSGMKDNEYYRGILPQIMKILLHDNQQYHKQAAAFTIFRAIVPADTSNNSPVAAAPVLSILLRPFLEISDEQPAGFTLTPQDALWSLSALISNTEPSPVFISQILSPIVASLYSMSYDASRNKLTDPQIKECVLSLLFSWGKIVDMDEATDTLWTVIENGRENEWKFGTEGRIWRDPILPKSNDLILPAVSKQDDEEDVDTNLFDLFPDPVHFIEFIKRLDRGDIGSSIFIRLLQNYRNMKGRSDENPIKTLHKLQIIMQMQKRLSEGTTSNILRKPDQLLSFILHVLDAAGSVIRAGAEHEAPAAEDGLLNEGDSDDEAPDFESLGPDEELVETAITLLLSILEDETLTVRVYPIFNEIFVKLELLALKGSSILRPLAREARLVITARLANVSGPEKVGPKREAEEDDQVYQNALKLLQDPILPVRAHGLLLLRGLAASKTRKVNKALVPSILSIFLQTVQDEDSYMFLNAVQGLAALADTFGKEIIQSLVQDYAGGLDGLGAGNMTQQDLDIRLRIGEALASVIKRCGTALGLYVEILVPPLFSTLRRTNIPTALRMSSLSLLAGCVDTYPWVLLPFIEDLTRAMIDLLQVETVPLTERTSEFEARSMEGAKEEPDGFSKLTIDSDPTSKSTKFPPLRRSGIHFLSLLIRAITQLLYNDPQIIVAGILSPASIRRLNITLGYISSTDEDNVVRVMAKEAKENLEAFQHAALRL